DRDHRRNESRSTTQSGIRPLPAIMTVLIAPPCTPQRLDPGALNVALPLSHVHGRQRRANERERYEERKEDRAFARSSLWLALSLRLGQSNRLGSSSSGRFFIGRPSS